MPGSLKSDLLNSLSLKSFKLKTKQQQQELLICVSIPCLVYVLASIASLFSVLRYESLIHEFDPYFNYRTTLFLTQKEVSVNSGTGLTPKVGIPPWPDHRWHALYPALMVRAALTYWTL